MLLSSAAAGFVTSAGLIIAIGAQNAFVLRQGVQRSHVGLVVAVCMASDMALIVCGVAGMGALVLAWPQLLQGLRFGGAAFLACYGLLAAHRAWRGTGALQPGQGQPHPCHPQRAEGHQQNERTQKERKKHPIMLRFAGNPPPCQY